MRVRHATSSILTFVLIAAFAVPAAAQQSVVTGTVTDAETGRPLENAQVSIIGSEGRGGLSNAQGVYRVMVEPGTYSVAVQLIGYADARVEGVRVSQGETETVDIGMNSRATVLNPLVVTASRREEKALESPSTIVTVGQERIEERAALSPVEHVKAMPGVDVSQTGLTQANIVTRGFNNVFSGAMLVITDNRYAHVPSLRFNAYNMIPQSQSDVERMEVLLGPAAALYGPNSANGVLHIITSSPIDDQGTTASVSGGERDVFQTQFRTAVKTGENTGLKVSARYFTGTDWRFDDPVEQSQREDAISDGADPGSLLIGRRDFDQERLGGTVRFDWRPDDDTELIINGGLNNIGSSVELTGIGAGQARDWRYTYAQTRFRKDRLFLQGFLNKSDAGDTYLLRTGEPIVDESELWVAQAQHGFALGERQDFIYGVDFQHTIPKTDGTITGRNEDDDEITQIGGYVHSQTTLSDQFDLIAAVRVDDHNRLDDVNVSPRAALIFNPVEDQSFRLTWNRAFDTPTTNNLFLDTKVQGFSTPFGFGYDFRTLGANDGFTFGRSCQGGVMGGLCMISPLAGPQRVPANAQILWDGLIDALAAQDPRLQQLAPAIKGPQAGDLGTLLRRFNQEAETFLLDPEGPRDINAIESTIQNVFEVGYKGIIGNRLMITADLYRTELEDFVGPLRVETPTVFYDPTTVQAYLTGRLTPLVQAGVITPQEMQTTIEGLVTAAAALPLGTVVPDQSNSSDILLTYRNFGDVDLWGADLAFQYLATDNFSVSGTYSHVSEECFDFNEDGTCTDATDIALNAPQNKGSLSARWHDDVVGLTLEGRARFVEGFAMNSGVYIGNVPGYGVIDANVAYKLSALPGARVSLTVTNLFDNTHREFVGAPEMGRLALLRLAYAF